MNNDQLKQLLIESVEKKDIKLFTPLLFGFIGVGVFGSLAAMLLGDTQQVMQAYLINFVFWIGITQGAVILSVVMRLTNAKWGRPIMRIAESASAFLPVTILLFIFIMLGGEKLFIWINEPVEHKAIYLNAPFMYTRVLVSLFLMTGLSLIYVRHSIRNDLTALYNGKLVPERFRKLLTNYDVSHIEKSNEKQTTLSVVLAICYAVCYSILAIDLIMSLDPHWVSTLFGAYYFIGCFYTGIAFTIILASYFIDRPDGKIVGSKQFHDLGKLLFGFAIVNGDFFYSQFLVIWYGNLPEETHYIIERTQHQPWATMAYIVLALSFVFPFLILINKKIKMNPFAMRWISMGILLGLWLERTLLIAPSVTGDFSFQTGLIQVAVTLGFLGIVVTSIKYFWSNFPMVVYSDPLLKHSLEGEK